VGTLEQCFAEPLEVEVDQIAGKINNV